MKTTKLTLSVDKSIIKLAKLYAEANKISLSKLIENYLKSLTTKSGSSMVNEPGEQYSSLHKLRGIVQLPDDFNYKEELAKAMTEKYKRLK